MRYEQLHAHLDREGVQVDTVDSIESSDLAVRLRNAHDVQLVSGEFHPWVYNNSEVIISLRERWLADRTKPDNDKQRVSLAGGPRVYLSGNASEERVNRLLDLIKSQFDWSPGNHRRYFITVARESLHYWLVDKKHLYFQKPHDDHVALEDRVTYYAECPQSALLLCDLFDQRVSEGWYQRLLNADDARLFDKRDIYEEEVDGKLYYRIQQNRARTKESAVYALERFAQLG